MKISICGTGYVGLTTGVSFAYLGHDVTCVDVNEEKIATLKGGKAPFYEPHLDEVLGLASDNMSFTTDYRSSVGCSDVVFIAVGTPSGPTGAPDLTGMHDVVHSIGAHLRNQFTLVVNKSTAPIGSGDWVDSVIREVLANRDGRPSSDRYAVCSNPEFLRQGSALEDIFYPDRVVVGSERPEATEILRKLYLPILEQTFPAPACLPRPMDKTSVAFVATSLASAELIKYAANAFLSLKISFINEIASLSEKVGADVNEVSKGIGHDARIGPSFLKAGLGWGGSCFGKDSAALVATASDYGIEMPIIAASRQVNYGLRKLVVDKLMSELKHLRGSKVGLLGLSFKPETDDLRDAPSLDIARLLLEKGAKVRAYDPVAMENTASQNPDLAIHYCQKPDEVFKDSDAVILVTEWNVFGRLDWEAMGKLMKKRVVLDGRNYLDPERLRRAGFRYLGLGRRG